MLAWWNSLTILEQVFACIAIAATVVLIIQSILLLFGIGFGGGEADAGGDPCDPGQRQPYPGRAHRPAGRSVPDKGVV